MSGDPDLMNRKPAFYQAKCAFDVKLLMPIIKSTNFMIQK